MRGWQRQDDLPLLRVASRTVRAARERQSGQGGGERVQQIDAERECGVARRGEGEAGDLRGERGLHGRAPGSRGFGGPGPGARWRRETRRDAEGAVDAGGPRLNDARTGEGGAQAGQERERTEGEAAEE